jgi:hypothetical protein
MDALALLRQQLRDAHATLERTVGGLGPAELAWVPPGTANPIGATFAHVVVAEDVLVHAVFAGGAPLGASTWAVRTGLSEPMPMPGPGWADYPAWTRRLRVDLEISMAYAHATWDSTDAWLASLGEADLDRELDLAALGQGRRTLGWAVARLLVAHCDSITGEIACLKGLQGRGGYG